MCAGRANKRKPARHRRKPYGGHMHFRGWLYATHQTLPTLPSMARVDVQGLWIALFRPNTCLAPLEWGGVVVVRPCATNRGRLLAVAKLDGVIDYPNCRSGLSARGGVLRFAPPVRIRGRKGSYPSGAPCGGFSLPLTLLLYHIGGQKSRGFGQKYCTKFEQVLARKLCNLTKNA